MSTLALLLLNTENSEFPGSFRVPPGGLRVKVLLVIIAVQNSVECRAGALSCLVFLGTFGTLISWSSVIYSPLPRRERQR
jgi:hypothetical protein